MANFIKWWKSKLFWKIFSTAIIAILVSLLGSLFIPQPYSLFVSIPSAIGGGLVIRKILNNYANERINRRNN